MAEASPTFGWRQARMEIYRMHPVNPYQSVLVMKILDAYEERHTRTCSFNKERSTALSGNGA